MNEETSLDETTSFNPVRIPDISQVNGGAKMRRPLAIKNNTRQSSASRGTTQSPTPIERWTQPISLRDIHSDDEDKQAQLDEPKTDEAKNVQ